MVLSIPLLTMSLTAYFTGLYLKKKVSILKHLICRIITGIAMGIYLSVAGYGCISCRSGLAGHQRRAGAAGCKYDGHGATQSEQRGGVTLYNGLHLIGVALGPRRFLLSGGLLRCLLPGSSALVSGILVFFCQ